jgi:hypothetical protein
LQNGQRNKSNGCVRLGRKYRYLHILRKERKKYNFIAGEGKYGFGLVYIIAPICTPEPMPTIPPTQITYRYAVYGIQITRKFYNE